MRALLRGKTRMPVGGSRSRWQILRAQYRRMTQAIRFGDLSEANDAYEHIRVEQAELEELSTDARLAFDALGDALQSGSLADATDGLRLFRLVLEGTSHGNFRTAPPRPRPDDDRPAETLRSGVVPAFVSTVGSELPETATIIDIDVAG
jgi:hypothetical protein